MRQANAFPLVTIPAFLALGWAGAHAQEYSVTGNVLARTAMLTLTSTMR